MSILHRILGDFFLSSITCPIPMESLQESTLPIPPYALSHLQGLLGAVNGSTAQPYSLATNHGCMGSFFTQNWKIKTFIPLDMEVLVQFNCSLEDVKIQSLLACSVILQNKLVSEKSDIAVQDGIEIKVVVLIHEVAKVGLLASRSSTTRKPLAHTGTWDQKLNFTCHVDIYLILHSAQSLDVGLLQSDYGLSVQKKRILIEVMEMQSSCYTVQSKHTILMNEKYQTFAEHRDIKVKQ